MSLATGPLREVVATRYVTALREGGSLPGLVEADDDGLYVTKFRGAGQGLRALVAEVIVGELARQTGLLVPELVTVVIDARLGAAEPDPEIQELIAASTGVNLGVDFLPGALAYTPAGAWLPAADLAAEVVWLDAFTTNVDRTARNPNLLLWHERLWLIDHGAALYLQHGGLDPAGHAARPFPLIAEHVLLGGRRARTTRVVRRHRRARGVRRLPDAAARRRRLRGRGRARPHRGGAMTATTPFTYLILRVVPSVERGERVNVGVVLFCRQRGFLGARVALDPVRLGILAPSVSCEEVTRHLEALVRVVEGADGAGPIAALPPSERFGWLAAPSSTIIQASEVHTGLSTDPEATLDALFTRLVAAPGRE
jgi:hypothetical protein